MVQSSCPVSQMGTPRRTVTCPKSQSQESGFVAVSKTQLGLETSSGLGVI